MKIVQKAIAIALPIVAITMAVYQLLYTQMLIQDMVLPRGYAIETVEADTETKDLYEAIDLTMEKIERQMRKEKTRKLKQRAAE